MVQIYAETSQLLARHATIPFRAGEGPPLTWASWILHLCLLSRSSALMSLIFDIHVLQHMLLVLCRWWVADSKGSVCLRTKVDTSSGCCKSGEKYSCAT